MLINWWSLDTIALAKNNKHQAKVERFSLKKIDLLRNDDSDSKSCQKLTITRSRENVSKLECGADIRLWLNKPVQLKI